ncbi:hypothetical protein AQUCO_11500007v1 [Aquilegia coerulea]|uniref:Uncharacterized protein n=1 Tax=Aquilegia coerulea TaxID=218851 RepID=A0A2G5C2A3_AQUCA|nr:hypothetical protein AQUCO_11500007v1 [Aquilegia coerulea]
MAAEIDVFTRSTIMATLLLAILLACACTTTDAKGYQAPDPQCISKCGTSIASCWPTCSKNPAQTATCMTSCISNGVACINKCKGPGRYHGPPSYMVGRNETPQIGN